MKLMRRTFAVSMAAAAALTVLATGSAFAQAQPAFPNKVIRIVPFGTGGGPIDTLARVYADKLSARWGQPVIVDAKPGASGIIAAQARDFNDFRRRLAGAAPEVGVADAQRSVTGRVAVVMG